MAVYYRFKSSLKIESMPIEGQFISVTHLKKRIIETKKFWWKDHLTITNAQTNEELDDKTLIPGCTSLVVCRLRGPVGYRLPIVVSPNKSKSTKETGEQKPTKSDTLTVESCVTQCVEEPNWDDFGEDVFGEADATTVKSGGEMQNNADPNWKIKVSTGSSGVGHTRMHLQDNFTGGRGMDGGMGGERGYGWCGFELRKPPQGYICFRCNVPGHFIQHCLTNGDPSYDIKRARFTMVTTDDSHTQPSGFVDVLKANESSCNKRVECSTSTQSVRVLPPELHCPLCQGVMKDATMSKCCFNSFCDTCIRNQIISKSICVCGVPIILADDLVANQTLRNTINRMLQSSSISSGSPRSNAPKQSVPMLSGTSTGGRIIPPPPRKDILDLKKAVNSGNQVTDPQAHSFQKDRSTKPSELSELKNNASHKKETELQTSALHAEEERKLELLTKEPEEEMQQRNSQDSASESLMMPFPHSNSLYFYPHTGGMPSIDYAYAYSNISHEGIYIQDPFQAQQYAMPMVPQLRDRTGFMRSKKFEERNTDLKRKYEKCCSQEREFYSDRKLGRDQRKSVGVSSKKLSCRTVTKETNHNNGAEKTHSRERFAGEAEPMRHSTARRHHNRAEKEHSLERHAGEADRMRHSKTSTHRRDQKENSHHNRMASESPQMNLTESAVSKKNKVSSSEIDYHNKDPDLQASSCCSQMYNPSSSRRGETVSSRGRGGKRVVKIEDDSSDVDDEFHYKRRRRSSNHRGLSIVNLWMEDL